MGVLLSLTIFHSRVLLVIQFSTRAYGTPKQVADWNCRVTLFKNMRAERLISDTPGVAVEAEAPVIPDGEGGAR